MKEINYIMTLLPYDGSVINLGNSFSQATRPKNVGQMSDLIQEYRESTDKPTRDGWESFYNDRIGLDKIDVATDKFSESTSPYMGIPITESDTFLKSLLTLDFSGPITRAIFCLRFTLL